MMEKRSRSTPAFSKESSVAGLCLKGLGLFSAASDYAEFRPRAGGECRNKMFTKLFPPALHLTVAFLGPPLPFGLVFHAAAEIHFLKRGSFHSTRSAQPLPPSPAFANAIEQDIH